MRGSTAANACSRRVRSAPEGARSAMPDMVGAYHPALADLADAPPRSGSFLLLLRRRRRDVVLLLPLSPLMLAVGPHPVHESALLRPLVDDHLVGVVAPDRRDAGDLDTAGNAAAGIGDHRRFEADVLVADDAVP